MRRPSPALVVSVIALVGAWGGPAVARTLITSADVKNSSLTTHDVKNRSLRGADMKSNTLTGRVVSGLSGRDVIDDGLDGSDIDESTLGEVPRAAAAGHADTASALAGTRVLKLSYIRLVNPDVTPLLDEGGIRIEGRCSGIGTLDVRAFPTGTGSGLVRVAVTRSNGSSVQADNDFREGDSISLVPGGSTDLAGTLSWWSPAGDVITVQYLAQEGLGVARGYQCAFAGTAMHATP